MSLRHSQTNCPKLQMDTNRGRDIDGLVQLEAELSTFRIDAKGILLEIDAKINLLKYLQVNMVKAYERVSTHLYFDLRHANSFDMLSKVEGEEPREGSLAHPKKMESIEGYLQQAGHAKTCLDELVELVVPRGTGGREGIPAAVKSLESARRKADKTAGGIHCVTDLARATVVCDTPQDLVDAFESLRLSVRQVKRINDKGGDRKHRQHFLGLNVSLFVAPPPR